MSADAATRPDLERLADDLEETIVDEFGVDHDAIRVVVESKPLPRSDDAFSTLTAEWIGDPVELDDHTRGDRA